MKNSRSDRLRYGRIVSMISLAVILSASFSQPASAFKTGEKAALVIGQSSFTTSTCSGIFGGTPPSRSGLCEPEDLAFDFSGNLWIVDRFNSRVLEFAPPFSNGENASLVIGQLSFKTNTCVIPPTQSGLCGPEGGLAFDSSGNLWVADSSNHRVVEFTPPFSNGENASLVIGQSSFTTNTCVSPPAQSGLCLPAGLAFDSSGNLWISDFWNSRVLEFAPPFSNGENASLVIGQSSFTSSTCRFGEFPSVPPTQSGLCGQVGLAFDSSGNLWVVDNRNRRVLEFAPPFSNGENASLVIGQSSFTTNTCSITQSGFCLPQDLAFDSRGNLWVSDYDNFRVLKFRSPFSNGENASLVIGQSSFTSSRCSGGFGTPPSQNGLCGPDGIAFDSRGNLWVSDFDNNRVLAFPDEGHRL